MSTRGVVSPLVPVASGAPCQVADAELWFDESEQSVARAKALCGTCEGREMCLALALERREPWGVWGGHLLHQGGVIARKPVRGRPRSTSRTTT